MSRPDSSTLAESKSFCILPWLHVRMNHDGNLYPCCRQTEFYPYGNVKEKSFEEIWNDEPIKKLRREFLAGEKPKICTGCYDTEATGNESYRQVVNRRHKFDFGRVDATDDSGHLNDESLLFLDLRLSNMCNFKCRSCGPYNSVAWYGDAEKISGEPLKGIVRPMENPEKFWEAFEKLLPNLNRIYFAGGEPLIEDMHYQVLERLIAEGRTDITLDYNSNFSNLTWKNWNVLELWNQFHDVTVGASLDGAGEQGELLRKGMDWKKTVENFKTLREKAPYVRFFVYMTVSAMNVFHVPDAVERFVKEGLVSGFDDFQINVATSPGYINLGILNDHERGLLIQRYEKFMSKAIEKFGRNVGERVANEMRGVLRNIEPVQMPKEREAFRRYTLGIDKLRGERFGFLFPEYLDLLYGAPKSEVVTEKR